ncbi:MAG: hypothetical protein C0392_15425 [Syntrophus sp. (in: bacteria)]|nr:hypothetical protein [Syntrophus sp. (in: bacteria)]
MGFPNAFTLKKGYRHKAPLSLIFLLHLSGQYIIFKKDQACISTVIRRGAHLEHTSETHIVAIGKLGASVRKKPPRWVERVVSVF